MNNTILPQNILSIQKCICGAITICTDDGREYYCQEENLKTFFPDIDGDTLKEKSLDFVQCCCNHCVNHWGLDICSCGSGENIGECDCGSSVPYQQIGQGNFKSENAWF